MRLLLVASLLLSSVAAAAEVYRWTDESGNVIFSDTPREGAEKIELEPTTVVPAQRPPRPTTRLSPKPDKSAGYESVAIASPAADETVRNQQSVAVQVAVQPGLRTEKGHKVQLFYDGKAYGEPRGGTTFEVSGLVRGSHQLAAAVLDAKGKELARSPAITFFVHQHSVLNP